MYHLWLTFLRSAPLLDLSQKRSPSQKVLVGEIRDIVWVLVEFPRALDGVETEHGNLNKLGCRAEAGEVEMHERIHAISPVTQPDVSEGQPHRR